MLWEWLIFIWHLSANILRTFQEIFEFENIWQNKGHEKFFFGFYFLVFVKKIFSFLKKWFLCDNSKISLEQKNLSYLILPVSHLIFAIVWLETFKEHSENMSRKFFLFDILSLSVKNKNFFSHSFFDPKTFCWTKMFHVFLVCLSF